VSSARDRAALAEKGSDLMMASHILGTGRALPPRVLTNADLEAMVDTSDAWISSRSGIKERRILAEGLANSDLATAAGRAACAAAGVPPAELDCIVLGTVTADRPVPSAAVYTQQKLGAGQCAAFDVSAGCSGFLYALAVGDALVRSGQYRRVLVIGVEVLSRITDWKDRNTCVLLGDGAGALVLGPAARSPARSGEATPLGRVGAVRLWADGSGAEHLFVPAGGSARPSSRSTVDAGEHSLKMNGSVVFPQAVRSMVAACQAVLDASGLTADQVDLVVPHQANLRIVEAVAQRLRLPAERMYVNIARYGNTSSASVPIALDEAVRDGRLRPGMTALLCAFGAGFTWGAALVDW
jgi:3-oxoacyl-[acyl-carrier-protein] synthase-3